MKHLSTMLRTITLLIFGVIIGTYITSRTLEKYLKKEENNTHKYLESYELIVRWLHQKHKGKKMGDYLELCGYKKVAIYGMHYIGERLYDELKDSGIEVLYAIDQNANSISSDLEVKTYTDLLPEVDAVIVTPIFYFNEIQSELVTRISYPIISLKKIIEGWEGEK